MVFHLSQGNNHQRILGKLRVVQKNRGPSTNDCVISYICTRVFHSFPYFTHCCEAYTIIPQLPKATFTTSIQQNLGLPHTHPPLTSAINSLLAMWYSTTWPSNLYTLWSALLTNSLLLALLHSTILRKHFISRIFTFRLSALLILHASFPYMTFVQFLLHIDISWPLSLILYCSAHYSTLPTLYTPNSFCAPHPLHILHQLKLVTLDT